MSKRKFPLWTLLGIVVVVALVVGSGLLSSSAPTPAQRAYAIESVIRCPSCEDLSVANSSAPTALTVRNTVKQLVSEGRSDQQIENYLVARYGSAIVLEPSTSGWSLLVWVLPLVGGVIAVAVLATFLIRRRGPVVEDPISTTGTRLLDPDSIEERRRFLDQSLADADAEYLAGDLSDQDYLALRHRDMVRLAALEVRTGTVTAEAPPDPATHLLVADKSPADGEHGPVSGPIDPADDPVAEVGTARTKRPRRSWWFLGGAIAAFAAALIIFVSIITSNRLPGQTATGSLSLSQAQQVKETLGQAVTYENEGQLGKAAQLYQSVLASHPDNEVAVAQLGWLEYETGQAGKSASLISDARVKLNRAVRLDPTDYAAHLYLGTLLLQQDGNAAGAVDQYRQFLADDPPAATVKQAADEIRQAYGKAGLPAPSQIGSG